MRITFEATEAGFEHDGFAVVCCVSGTDATGVEHYLMFQRLAEEAAVEQPDEDWGVYLEFDGQGNGGYGCVRSCCLGRSALLVDLSRQLGRLEGVEGFSLGLKVHEQSWIALSAGLACSSR